MATSKIYELLFRLKAQADNSVNDQFAQANAKLKELTETRKKYQETLGKAEAYRIEAAKLADLKTAYDNVQKSTTKYTAEIEKLKGKKDALTTKLDNEKQKLADLEAKQQQAGNSSQSLTDKIAKQKAKVQELEGQIKSVDTQIAQYTEKEKQAQTPTAEQTAKLQQQQDKVDRLANALKEAGIDVSKLSTEEQELVKKIQQVIEEEQRQRDATDELGDSSENSLANLVALQQVADTLSSAFDKVASAITSTISSAGNLQYTMAGVTSISSATEEESDALMEKAKEIGATTKWTASEVASAMETAALAGWDTTQMVDGMTAVTNLATAANEDLGSMISITSDALSAFGLSGSAAVQEFTDVLTKAATSSNTTVGMMGESLSYVESTAANLGYSLEDVTTALAVMANQSLKSSVSGSALNTMLTRMSGANTTASKEMDNLNLSMYNADGTAKPLIEFFDELRQKFKDGSMTAQEMQISAYKLAGQRGMRGLLSIVNTSDEAWQQMINDVQDYEGAASYIQDIRMDTYQGQLYLLESAWDALKTSIGEDFLPVATSALETLTGIVTAADNFVQGHDSVAGALLAIAGGLGAMAATGAALAAVGGAMTAIEIATDALNAKLAVLEITAGGLIGVAGFFGMTLAATAYADSLIQASEAAQDLASSAETLEETIDTSDQNYDDTTATWQKRYERIKEIQEQEEEIREKLEEAERGYEEAANDPSNYINVEGTDVITDEGQRTLNKYTETINGLKSAMAGLKDEETTLIGENTKITASDNTVSSVQNQINSMISGAATSSDLSFGIKFGLDPSDVTLTEDQIADLESSVAAFSSAWNDAYSAADEALLKTVGLTKEATEATETSIDTMSKNVQAQQESMDNYAKNLQEIFDSGIDVSAIYDDLTDGSADALGMAQAIADELRGGNENSVVELINAEASVQQTISNISENIANHNSEVKDAFQSVLDEIDTDAETYADKGKTVAEGVIEGLTSAMLQDTSAASTATTWGDQTIEAIKDATGVHSPSTITTEIGQNLSIGLSNGIASYSATVANTAAIVAKLATATMKNNADTDAWYTMGANMVQGLINGINSKISELERKIKELDEKAKKVYKTTDDQASPSKAWRKMGVFSMQGLINGYEDMQSDLAKASADASTVAQKSYSEAKPATNAVISNGSGSSSGGTINLTYSPTITGGDTSSIKALLEESKTGLMTELNAAMSNWTRQRERRAYT